MFTHFLANSILLRIWDINKFYGLIKGFLNDLFDFIESNIEKFTSSINHIQFSIFKCSMERSFQSWKGLPRRPIRVCL